ncbi:MAG: putative DNA-binding domain-containing protein [Holophaga sp.]|nr:putative DNA-binding domain-containing protein [Holophaga sp.]
MSEALVDSEMAEVLDLQRALVKVALAPGPDATWPQVEFSLSTVHQTAVDRARPSLLAYRELVRVSLWDPMEAVFPITRALVGEEEWEALRQAFLATGGVASRHYRDIPPTFVGWLAEQPGWQAQRPGALQLAHLELVEMLVAFASDPLPEPSLLPEPAGDRRLYLHPSAQLLQYEFAVHRATVASPQPEQAPTHLLAFRNQEDDYQLLEVTPATSALLTRAQQESLAVAMQALGLLDASAVFQLLVDLRNRGAILGFVA